MLYNFPAAIFIWKISKKLRTSCDFDKTPRSIRDIWIAVTTVQLPPSFP